MQIRRKIGFEIKQFISYLKDYSFGSILKKYFFLLFICLLLPSTVVTFWYGKRLEGSLWDEIVKRNEASLMQAYDNVNSIIYSVQNTAYSLSIQENVLYLSTKMNLGGNADKNLDELQSMLKIVKSSNDYLDSVGVYFRKSNQIVTDTGAITYDEYEDIGCLERYTDTMKPRSVVWARKKGGRYPYLMTVLQPVSVGKSNNVGAIFININVEAMGAYIGSGQYRNKDYAPMLLIFDDTMDTLIYSDEYRLLHSEEEREKLKILKENAYSISQKSNLWDRNYVVSGSYSQTYGFHYLYLSSMHQFELESKSTDKRIFNFILLIVSICLILACLLAVWVYRPIRRTLCLLENMSMLTEWDKKDHIDEIEAIQRSILSAKQEQSYLNEQIQERIISLHNAQICALQTQINPHFLYNTLESIGNMAALLMEKDNVVSEMVYTLGKLMRISLSSENYLVCLKEEMEHVGLYAKLIGFRFRDRICMHIDIPQELYEERIVKLTLQPLIENAIEHGLLQRRTRGDIWITGEKCGTDNYIYVRDNGKGMSKEQVKQLQEQLMESSISGGSHIGLRNVDQRLKLVFGEECGLQIKCVVEGGLCIIIHFKTIKT